MRRPKDHRPVILKAAARLFGQKRFHEVLMEDVADAAGVAKGTIYRFYPTKEALLVATCLVSLDELAGALHEVARRPESAKARLRRMCERAAQHFRQNHDFFEVLQREWGHACFDKGSPFMARRSTARGIYATVIRDGQAAGEFRAVHADTAADMLMGLNRAMREFGDPRLTPAQLAGLVVDVFLHGIGNAKGKKR